MPQSLPSPSDLFPVLYGVCFLLLLWQAFRVMAQGFRAVPRPSDRLADRPGDRTGRVTVHPELLDADGQLTREDLLTVRFSGDNERPAFPGDAP
ncbi:MAG: DUF2973 domain-containing protein [Synechococcaceae cyanobacterium]|nr:DUF2973 domain-containing protein [Synechococcaceae cyanobacterium]